MSAPSAKMLVFVGEKCVCVKIAGRANFTSSVDFKSLLQELVQKGYRYFVLDLTDCALMDSTFLGVLAGFGLKLNAPQGEGTFGTLELFNPNARIAELLENLGVLHLFQIVRGDVKMPDNCEQRDLAPGGASREEV